MKTSSLTQKVFYLLCVCFLSACSKERITTNSNNADNSSLKNDSKGISLLQSRIIPTISTGSIKCYITPLAAKPEVHLGNSSVSLGPFYPDGKGNLIVDDLQPGTYDMKIKAINPAYTSVGIQNITVIAGLETNLGVIILQ